MININIIGEYIKVLWVNGKRTNTVARAFLDIVIASPTAEEASLWVTDLPDTH